MASIQEWAKHEEQLKQTSRLQVNLQSWEEGDILHFYQDLVIMFQELQSDDIVLSNKNRRIIANGYTSFDKIFNRKKS
jgi:hypothetical protein